VDTKKILKIAGLNVGIAFFNIIIFSPGLIGISFTDSTALHIAIGGTVVFLSAVLFFYGNYKLLSPKTNRSTKINLNDIKSTEDCITALKQAYGKETFNTSIDTVIEQVEVFIKKKEKIFNTLRQKFNIIDELYEKFIGTILDVEYVFISNIKSILNNISIFDEEDYKRARYNMTQKKISNQFVISKMNIYSEYISFVKNAIEDNEEIILKLDALLLELSRFNSLETGELENMKEIKEMDDLIKRSKHYR